MITDKCWIVHVTHRDGSKDRFVIPVHEYSTNSFMEATGRLADRMMLMGRRSLKINTEWSGGHLLESNANDGGE